MLKDKLLTTLIFVLLFLFLFEVGTVIGDGNEVDRSIVLPEGSDVSGTIYRGVFLKSVPREVVIGESYSFPVFIKNNGNSNAKFHLYFFAPENFFYSEFSDKFFNLGKGEVIRYDARVVPIQPYVGELNITAKLYTVIADQDVELDSATTSIFLIERKYGTYDLILIVVVAVLILGIVLFLYKKIE